MIKISKTSKMPCKSWSLPARTTCPGSVYQTGKKKGQEVPACQGCYATQGFYRMPVVQKSREENRNDWVRDDWVADMVAAIGTDSYFRWFDSGDIYHPKLAKKIQQVVELTPQTNHWLPTRSYQLPKLKKLLDKLAKECDNIVVRYSSNEVDGTYKRGLHGSTIVADDKTSSLSKGVHVCPASLQDGKCNTCRACWDKKVKVVAYIAHTKQMEKVINDR